MASEPVSNQKHEKAKRRSLLNLFYSSNSSYAGNSKPMSEQEYQRFVKFIRPFSVVNRWVYKLTAGRVMGAAAGLPLMLITFTGAKTGKRRTVPVIHVPYNDGVIAVGSLGGAPKSPLWVKSLLKNPDIDVQFRSKKMKLRARLAEGEERSTVWPTCTQYLTELEKYQKRTEREIPIFICEPR